MGFDRFPATGWGIRLRSGLSDQLAKGKCRIDIDRHALRRLQLRESRLHPLEAKQ